MGNAKYGLVGRVVAVDSYYHDGLVDYGTLIWVPETGEIVSGPSFMDSCPVGVDAPAWVVAFYGIAKSLEARARAAREAAVMAQIRAEDEAARVRPGKTVMVVRGRKVAKGQSAVVFWHGQTQYGWRVGLELVSGERVFTDAGNVEVVEGPSRPFAQASAGQKAA